MLFFLRWPIVLILLALAAASVVPALLGTIEAYHLPVDLSAIAPISDNIKKWAASTTMPERVLWYVAAVLFFIAAVRLIRRTQGFWMWLLGFAAYGGRWALAQSQQEGGLMATVNSIKPEDFKPEVLASGGSSAQATFLVVMLVIGILIHVVDAADRDYWDRQRA